MTIVTGVMALIVMVFMKAHKADIGTGRAAELVEEVPITPITPSSMVKKS